MAGLTDILGVEEMLKLEQMVANSNPAQQVASLPPPQAMPQQALQAKPAPLPQAAAQPKLSYATEYENALKETMARRQSANDDLQNQLKEKLGRKFGFLEGADLTGAMAFADQMLGSNMSASYKAPTAIKDNQLAVEKLQEQIRKGEEGMSDDQLGYLKLRLQEEMADQRDRRMTDRLARAGENEESKLRREFLANPAMKDFNDVDASWRAISSNPAVDGAAQQALVYSFSKLLDPGSVVRETEYAMSRANAGKLAQATNFYNNLVSGQQLTPQQVALMKEVARGLYESYRKKVEAVRKPYEDLARRKGFNPQNVIIDTYGFDQKPTSPSGPSGAMSFEQWKASKAK